MLLSLLAGEYYRLPLDRDHPVFTHLLGGDHQNVGKCWDIVGYYILMQDFHKLSANLLVQQVSIANNVLKSDPNMSTEYRY